VIISRTPFRMSFFGGGTDYPAWYEVHGGAVLGTTINKYCYISIRYLPPFFEHKHRVVYSRIELCADASEIEHPSVRACVTEMGVDHGLEIQHAGDLPARSGLGSSSSFTVGLLNALHALQGRMIASQELAEEAIRIEQHVIKEKVGSQDQVWAAFGGMNRIDFLPSNGFHVTPLIMKRERLAALSDNILLFFTGFSRNAETIARRKIENLNARDNHLKTMRSIVDEAEAILQSPDRSLDDFGKLLHESWQLKRELADGVSNPEIDALYEAGREGGALGGKLLGAGGGGFMIFYARPEHHAAIRDRLESLIEVSFEMNSPGSKIVLCEPNGLATI
jgi:D-glycero-alpha-D-manno-heptose-7-phosphate kinase